MVQSPLDTAKPSTDTQSVTLAALNAIKSKCTKPGRIVLYLDGLNLTNWPSSLVIPIRRQQRGSHNIAGSRVDVWFQAPDGSEWHGVNYGENSQLTHCKKLKDRFTKRASDTATPTTLTRA